MPSTSDLPCAVWGPFRKTRSRLSSTCSGHFPICFLRISPLVLNPCRQRALGFLTISASLPIFSKFSSESLLTLYNFEAFSVPLSLCSEVFKNLKSHFVYVWTWNLFVGFCAFVTMPPEGHMPTRGIIVLQVLF